MVCKPSYDSKQHRSPQTKKTCRCCSRLAYASVRHSANRNSVNWVLLPECLRNDFQSVGVFVFGPPIRKAVDVPCRCCSKYWIVVSYKVNSWSWWKKWTKNVGSKLSKSWRHLAQRLVHCTPINNPISTVSPSPRTWTVENYVQCWKFHTQLVLVYHNFGALSFWNVSQARSLKSLKKSIKPLFWRSRLTKVIDFGANREPVYDFLLVINSNLGPISHRFWGIATYWLKIANFVTIN